MQVPVAVTGLQRLGENAKHGGMKVSTAAR
jgi:hypothetical protein